MKGFAVYFHIYYSRMLAADLRKDWGQICVWLRCRELSLALSCRPVQESTHD